MRRFKPQNSTLSRAWNITKKLVFIKLTISLMVAVIYPASYAVSSRLLQTGVTVFSTALPSDRSMQLQPMPAQLSRDLSAKFDDVGLVLGSQDSSNFVEGQPQVVVSDPRVIAMRNFLRSYNSPMVPYADIFIFEADRYGLDWRLVASISGVESAFGTLIPPNSNNGWGWKGDPTREWSYFSSWSDAIRTVTRGLALGYGVDMTPFDIEPIYCPPCGRTPGSPWANGVIRFMNQLDVYLSEV